MNLAPTVTRTLEEIYCALAFSRQRQQAARGALETAEDEVQNAEAEGGALRRELNDYNHVQVCNKLEEIRCGYGQAEGS